MDMAKTGNTNHTGADEGDGVAGVSSTSTHNAMIHAPTPALAIRQTSLAERGVKELPAVRIDDHQVKTLCADLSAYDFDDRARALEVIATLAPSIKRSRRHLDSLVLPLIDNLHHYYGPNATVEHYFDMELGCHGENYPPDANYLQLLLTALEALSGPSQSPYAAVLDSLLYAAPAAQIVAVEWVGTHRLAGDDNRMVVDYVQDALASLRQLCPLRLALLYADALLHDNAEEFIHFLSADVISGDASNDTKTAARRYLDKFRLPYAHSNHGDETNER